MRRRAVLFALVSAVVLIPAGVPASGQIAGGFPEPFDLVVMATLKEFHAPGAAVVVVKGGEIVYLKGFGVKKLGTDDPVTPDTVFAIASCTKAFTSTLVGMLVDDGKLGWDDKVHDRLSDFRLSDIAADRETTLRDLLSHRTGMPRHDLLWSGRTTDTTDLIHRWSKAKPSTSFRSTWEYANVPFTTAGLIAGRSFKTSWAGAVRRHILDPLGMVSSSVTLREALASEDHATPHYLGFDQKIRPVDWDDVDAAGGAGCVNSTARDMARWLQFQLAGGQFGGKRLISSKSLRETHSPQMIVKPEGTFANYFPPLAGHFVTYGLGWFVHDYRGQLCLSHGGTLTGFRAQVMLIPERQLGVCVLTNLRPSYVPETIAKSVLDLNLGLPPVDWIKFHKDAMASYESRTVLARTKRETARVPDTQPSLELAQYAGRYEEPAYGRAEVTEAGGKLTLTWGKMTFRLDHYHYDTFTAVPLAPKEEVLTLDRTTFEAQFRLNDEGQIEGMKLFDQDFKRLADEK